MRAIAGSAGTIGTEHVFRIGGTLDVFDVRRAVRAEAYRVGFDRRVCEELVIVVSELASNILKHGVRGEIRLSPGECRERGPFLAINADDIGPPIPDLNVALQDGCSASGPIDPMTLLKRGGIGTGLGAVLRFTDSFEHLPREGGKSIRVRRYLLPKPRTPTPR